VRGNPATSQNPYVTEGFALWRAEEEDGVIGAEEAMANVHVGRICASIVIHGIRSIMFALETIKVKNRVRHMDIVQKGKQGEDPQPCAE